MFFCASFLVLKKPDRVNAEMKFTLSADSSSSSDSIYEDDQEKLSDVPEYIKKLASKGNNLSIASRTNPRF